MRSKIDESAGPGRNSSITFGGLFGYQLKENLRLEAGFDAFSHIMGYASAAYRVGYDDASHFNREYKRLFGLPPMRDVERLRQAVRQNGGLMQQIP